MELKKRYYLYEHIVYIVFWLMLFFIPIFGFWLGRQKFLGSNDFNPLFGTLMFLCAYLVMFLINDIICIPKLLFQKKVVSYLIVSLILCAVVTYGSRKIEQLFHIDNGPAPHEQMDGGLQRPDRPHDFSEPQKPSGPNGNFGPRNTNTPKDPNIPAPIDRHGPHQGIDMFFRVPGGSDFGIILMALLVLSFNIAMKFLFRAMENNIKDKTLEKENIRSELEYLKYQINPHFLMNTLNNIHALVDIDPTKAKDNVIRLSKLMRFVLYKGPEEAVSLQDEINFLQDYIDLMRIRFTDSVEIKYSYPDIVPTLKLPSLLFVTFIENAFKHGVSYQNHSYIYIDVSTNDKYITLNVKNSKFNDDNKKKEGGVGIDNTMRRLKLIYGDDYKLDIDNGVNDYSVKLKIRSL